MKAAFLLPLLAVCACGSSSNTLDPEPAKLPLPVNPLFFGTDGDSSANGLAFATAATTIEDIEGAGPFTARVARFKTDWDTGETRLLITDETVTINALDIGGEDDETFTITLEGETLTFVDGDGPNVPGGGRAWESYFFDEGEASGILTFYSYAFGPDGDPDVTGEFDSEAFLAVGFETDPSQIAALSGEVGYFGNFYGYGQGLNSDGDVVNAEVQVEGDIAIMADFGASRIDGTLEGEFDDDIEFEMAFDTDIVGNGYASSLACTSGCNASASNIGGVFYGQDALETTGVIGLDISNEDGERFVSGAGYIATQDGPDESPGSGT